MNRDAPPELGEYQWGLVHRVRTIVADWYIRRTPPVRILDAGCDPSGKQLWHLADTTCGEVIGINIKDNFPSPEAVNLLQSKTNVTLRKMDAMNLEFPDESFDLVVSANVMEHIPNPRRFIAECCRVLKRNGTAYFETCPIWTSARGHHIHADMINEWFPAESYRNDGAVIPDWSHLLCTESQMRSLIEGKLRKPAVDYVLSYIYHSKDINRVGWREISSALKASFPITETLTYGTYPRPNNSDSMKPQDGNDDYDIAGFEILGHKGRQPAFKRIRAAWCRRRRRVGLALHRRLDASQHVQ
jgi:ubiquinone/menaquinone biosynthesis C-methylase UbiE